VVATDLKQLDRRPIPSSPGEIRLLAHVRNESARLPHFLSHHRALGVDRFLVIDNGSRDGSVEFLLAEPDVHVFYTEESYREQRAVWKRTLLDRWCMDHWTLQLDADELFVYPHHESAGLRQFCDALESEGARGVHAVMIDMYGEDPIDRNIYAPGQPFLEACPYFDANGYRIDWFSRRKRARTRLMPPFQIRGGMRERLFFPPEAISTRLAAFVGRWFWDIRARRPRGGPAWKLLRRAVRRTAGRSAPSLSKVPLLRWGSEIRIEDAEAAAFHAVTPPIPLSACWAGSLHFKFLGDFPERVADAVARGQHAGGAAEYRRYQRHLDGGGLWAHGAMTRRYESSESLLEAGLLRSTPAWDQVAGRVHD
jgi:hypothetical protein